MGRTGKLYHSSLSNRQRKKLDFEQEKEK